MKGEILHGSGGLKAIGAVRKMPFMQTLYPHRSVGCGSSEGGVKQVDLPELMPRAHGQASRSGARKAEDHPCLGRIPLGTTVSL